MSFNSGDFTAPEAGSRSFSGLKKSSHSNSAAVVAARFPLSPRVPNVSISISSSGLIHVCWPDLKALEQHETWFGDGLLKPKCLSRLLQTKGGVLGWL